MTRYAPAARVSRMPAWLWLLQRLSGLLILGLVMAHMVVNHYVDPATTITVGYVIANVRKLTFLLVDSCLLLLALFHGMTGLRNVLFDFVSRPRARSLVAWACTVVGAAFFAFGLAVLLTVMNR
ncbi:MAG: hypothetical protein FJ313_04980 [Gemmatimonadetes bacterium]|nr:hypothetical protein [Gemmatimonadota bacterium]